jgi:uncharacterized membrane protein YoaK (UPF0700 family)
MQCRNCGTEIADKAIVCYRCGTATTEAVRRPAEVRARRSPVLSLAVMLLLVLLALYLGQASRSAADPQGFQLAAGICAGVAAVILLLRVLRRR